MILKMHRAFRKLVALIGIVAVLLSQFAVSAHACPMQLAAGAGEMAMPMASGTNDDANIDLPALCQKHCQDERQNMGDQPSPLASVALMPSFVVTLSALPATGFAAITPLHTLQHATSPPHSIRNCCFRI